MLVFVSALVALFLCLSTVPGLAYAPAQVQALIHDAARRHGVPVALALEVSRRESGYRCTAKNPRSTAYGPFQIIKGTGRGLGINRADCRQNVDGGVRLLRTAMHSPSRLCATYEAMCGRSHRRMRVASR